MGNTNEFKFGDPVRLRREDQFGMAMPHRGVWIATGAVVDTDGDVRYWSDGTLELDPAGTPATAPSPAPSGPAVGSREAMRFEAAKAAMAGMLANAWLLQRYQLSTDKIAEESVLYADALLAALDAGTTSGKEAGA